MTNTLNTAIVNNFEQVSAELAQFIETLPEEQINSIPSVGGWSVRQIVDHIIKANDAHLHLITEPGVPTQRDPSEKIAVYQSSFSGKETAPDFLLPESNTVTKEQLLSEIFINTEAVKNVLSTSDLSLTCADFEYGDLGDVTRNEVAHFIVLHTQRHLRQLRNLPF